MYYIPLKVYFKVNKVCEFHLSKNKEIYSFKQIFYIYIIKLRSSKKKSLCGELGGLGSGNDLFDNFSTIVSYLLLEGSPS